MADRKTSKEKANTLDSNQQLLEKIGKRIKSLRLKAGYTNSETFAFEHEFGRSQYANWERGQDMKVTSLYRIAAAHKITLSELLDGVK